jgi:hypothetical protein
MIDIIERYVTESAKQYQKTRRDFLEDVLKKYAPVRFKILKKFTKRYVALLLGIRIDMYYNPMSGVDTVEVCISGNPKGRLVSSRVFDIEKDEV